MKAACRQVTRSGKTLGFVPTMGALHEGHLSLVRAAKSRCNVVAASIFVNPLQFGPTEDLAKYPRTLERDCALLEELGVDLVFVPTADEMYGSAQVSVQPKDANPSASSGQAPGHQDQDRNRDKTYVVVEGLSDRLDGASRPGHFRGVATVVNKLFEIVARTARSLDRRMPRRSRCCARWLEISTWMWRSSSARLCAKKMGWR